MKNQISYLLAFFILTVFLASCSQTNDGPLSELYENTKDEIDEVKSLSSELVKAQSEAKYTEVKNLFDKMNLMRAQTQDRINKLISSKNGIKIPFEQKNSNAYFVVKEIKAVGMIWNSNLDPNVIFSASVLLKDTLRDSFFGRWEFFNSKNSVIDNSAFYSATKLIGTPPEEIIEIRGNTIFSKISDFQKFVIK